MVVLQSCDHHDVGGCVPNTRSRARILQQFGYAIALGDAFMEMLQGSLAEVAVEDADGRPLPDPTITIQLKRFLACWEQYMLWLQHQPRGDDLAPAVDPPSEIRVPPEG